MKGWTWGRSFYVSMPNQFYSVMEIFTEMQVAHLWQNNNLFIVHSGDGGSSVVSVLPLNLNDLCSNSKWSW